MLTWKLSASSSWIFRDQTDMCGTLKSNGLLERARSNWKMLSISLDSPMFSNSNEGWPNSIDRNDFVPSVVQNRQRATIGGERISTRFTVEFHLPKLKFQSVFFKGTCDFRLLILFHFKCNFKFTKGNLLLPSSVKVKHKFLFYFSLSCKIEIQRPLKG